MGPNPIFTVAWFHGRWGEGGATFSSNLRVSKQTKGEVSTKELVATAMWSSSNIWVDKRYEGRQAEVLDATFCGCHFELRQRHALAELRFLYGTIPPGFTPLFPVAWFHGRWRRGGEVPPKSRLNILVLRLENMQYRLLSRLCVK